VGALGGSLLLSWSLLPALGFAKTAQATGMLCLGSAFLLSLSHLKQSRLLQAELLICMLLGALCFSLWGKDERYIEQLTLRTLPQAKLVYSKRSRYQEIRFVRYKGHHFLTLNRQPQFSTQDEHRYHEALVHPAMSLAPSRKRVLILGGGDGLALREIWRYPDVREVVMVDLDPEMTRFGLEHPIMRKYNQDAMRIGRQKGSKRALHILNLDAWKYIYDHKKTFDVILSDLPDATNISLSKLYSVEFYRLLRKRLANKGVMAIQATSISPGRRKAFWCIHNTIQHARFHTLGYHVWVPSFGQHTTFVLASKNPLRPQEIRFKIPTRYISEALLPSLFWFPKDIAPLATKINRIDTHILLRYLLR